VREALWKAGPVSGGFDSRGGDFFVVLHRIEMKLVKCR
jgi:hypothetical protein